MCAWVDYPRKDELMETKGPTRYKENAIFLLKRTRAVPFGLYKYIGEFG